MKLSKRLEEVWKIKEKMSQEISGLTPEEVVKYFQDRLPERAKNLPMKPIPTKSPARRRTSV